MCDSDSDATWWTNCFPVVQSFLDLEKQPLCPSLNGFSVCSRCSFFIPSQRCCNFTRYTKIRNDFHFSVHINSRWVEGIEGVHFTCMSKALLISHRHNILFLCIQGLTRQYVLGIVHSTLSTSQIGETGFDRLAMGFCSMVPILTQALKEELHVLSGLAEPHTILGFINEAYLNTVATEFASLMERECETAHRDNTAPSVKTKKYSVKSRATVGKHNFFSKCFYIHLFFVLFLSVAEYI